jgi:hypothetical protein
MARMLAEGEGSCGWRGIHSCAKCGQPSDPGKIVGRELVFVALCLVQRISH